MEGGGVRWWRRGEVVAEGRGVRWWWWRGRGEVVVVEEER